MRLFFLEGSIACRTWSMSDVTITCRRATTKYEEEGLIPITHNTVSRSLVQYKPICTHYSHLSADRTVVDSTWPTTTNQVLVGVDSGGRVHTFLFLYPDCAVLCPSRLDSLLQREHRHDNRFSNTHAWWSPLDSVPHSLNLDRNLWFFLSLPHRSSPKLQGTCMNAYMWARKPEFDICCPHFCSHILRQTLSLTLVLGFIKTGRPAISRDCPVFSSSSLLE